MIDAKPNTEQNLPMVTVDVARKNVDELKGLKPGDAVKVVLTGKVVEVSLREPDVSYPGFSGMLRIEVKSTLVVDQNNSFSALMEEDE